jgi:glyoxylase-like metal-dependent hydrolase (beta-lactamase superfamily II)
MRKLIVMATACVLVAVTGPSAQQTDALRAAGDLLGVANVKTLEFTGWGATFSLGANFSPNDPWPRVLLRNYKATINYDTASMRVELLREMGPYMPLGDGVPFMGEQRQIHVVSGVDAWNVPVPAPGAPQAPAVRPTPGTTGQALDPAVDRMLTLWATPYGFVKAAMANQATERSVRGGTEVAFTIGGRYKMVGIINSQHQVERVRTWIDYPLMGDVLVETVYRVYKDFDGVLFPASIVQSQGGFPTLDVTTISVKTNVPADIIVPDNVRGAKAPPVRVDVQKVADGVYFFTGGHNSLAIEMQDHIVIFDTPNSEARGLAVIAKAKELIPNKPVRYVINSHHHWDHSAGLRAAMDEGATIVIHESNRAFFEQVAKRPHTLVPDRLSKSKKTPKFLTFGADGLELTDGTRTLAVYEISPNEHALDLAMVYLPKEKILAEADAYNSGADPGELLTSVEVPKALALYETILRRKLDVNVIVPFHGAKPTTFENLKASLGKTTTSQ